MTEATLRAWRWHQQGLGQALNGRSAHDVLAHTGWSRSVGGCNPYLALFARAGLPRTTIDSAVAALEIHELPAARGCTYVVPASDFALALRAGQGKSDDADVETAKKHLGVTQDEIEGLCRAVLDALAEGPLDPAAMKQTLGPRVRSLGEAGKKRGLSTTLPLALGLLQAQGELRRVPINGRLDQQRYRYCRWTPSPLAGSRISDDEIACELARRFFRWAAPATVKQLAWWAGLSVKSAKAAVQPLGLVPLPNDPERLLSPNDLDALRAYQMPAAPHYALVGSLDNLGHLRRDASSLMEDDDRTRELSPDRKTSTVWDLPHHAILDRGQLIGYWDYDGQARIVWTTFRPAPALLAQEIARTEVFVRDQLGDARSFSLDSPESRGERLASLRREAPPRSVVS